LRGNGYPLNELISAINLGPTFKTPYTHSHPDHFEPGFATRFYEKTRRPVLGTAGVAELLPEVPVEQGSVMIKDVRVTPVPSRHLGVEWRQHPHVSYLVEGSKRVFIVGDAVPLCWKEGISSLRPDVLVAPYPYITTAVGRQTVLRFAPQSVMLVHMPAKDRDPDGIWPMTERALKEFKEITVQIPELGESVIL